MKDSNAVVAPENVLAEIWKEILQVDQVGSDDDFFSLGGDSLLAIKVIGAAQEKGLALSLLDLFKNPTPRGACAALRPHSGETAAGAADLLTPLDRARVPDEVADAYPAARLQLGLIYESLVSDGAFYLDVISRTVNRALDQDALRQALDWMSARHAVLRTRFDLATFSEPMQVVEQAAPIPLETADHRGLDEATALVRYEQVMTELAQPYDPESAPLLRVHATATCGDTFRLSYSFHHAILDGWSEAVFFNELVRTYAGLLQGTPPQFADPAPYVEFVRLEREALRNEASVRYFKNLRDTLPAQGEVAGAPFHRKVSAAVPAADAERLAECSAQWGLPTKSLLVAVNCVAVGAAWGTDTPVVGVLLNGRPELVGADITLGLFLNQLPLRLDLADATWRMAARRALDAENELLAHRRFPHSEVRRLLDRNPFQVTFNYVHFRPRDELLEAGLLMAEEDMRDHTSLPVRVEALNDPQGQGLSLHVTVDVARFGDDLPERLLNQLLEAIHGLVGDPDGAASVSGYRG